MMIPIKTREEKESCNAQYQGGVCFNCGGSPHLCECDEYEDEDVIIKSSSSERAGG